MNRILSWYTPTNNGAFQRRINTHWFTEALKFKPVMSFDYINFEYDESIQRYVIDNINMTDSQKQECANYVDSVEPPLQWYQHTLSSIYINLYDKGVDLIYDTSKDIYAVSTWQKQVEEARKCVNGDSSSYLESLLTSRAIEGETIEFLANKIIKKSEDFEREHIKLLGTLEGNMHRLSTIKTRDEAKKAYNDYFNNYMFGGET